MHYVHLVHLMKQKATQLLESAGVGRSTTSVACSSSKHFCTKWLLLVKSKLDQVEVFVHLKERTPVVVDKLVRIGEREETRTSILALLAFVVVLRFLYFFLALRNKHKLKTNGLGDVTKSSGYSTTTSMTTDKIAAAFTATGRRGGEGIEDSLLSPQKAKTPNSVSGEGTKAHVEVSLPSSSIEAPSKLKIKTRKESKTGEADEGGVRWSLILGQKEKIVMKSVVKKWSGFGYKRRILVLTDKPELFYLRPNTNRYDATSSKVNLSLASSTEVCFKNGKKFTFKAKLKPQKTIETPGQDAEDWVYSIKKAIEQQTDKENNS